MKQTALSYFTDSHLTLLALILFFMSFVFLIYRVYFFERRETFERLERIPLDENSYYDHDQRRSLVDSDEQEVKNGK
jgi:cbb3-type cytochrome oxidase subunit 3